jgi:hypothetical protein
MESTKYPGHKMETFFDRSTRSYVTMLVHENGDQCGDAMYDGTKADRDASRRIIEPDKYCTLLDD